MILITGRIAEDKKGFTLMEMLVVLAVIVLIIGISIPFFASFTKGAKLKTAAKDVMAVLNTARSYAITQRKNFSVILDSSSRPHAYYITDPDGQVVGKNHYLPSAVSFDSYSGSTTFSSTGGLSGSAGVIGLVDKKGNFRRIRISNTTGRVRIE